jgi:hypothetical protein
LNFGQGKVAAFNMESGPRKHVQNLLLGYGGLEQADVLINPANGEERQGVSLRTALKKDIGIENVLIQAAARLRFEPA